MLVARFDTFLIRSYGEALNANGKVVARAWCEAVIQRQPTLVGENGTLLTKSNDAYKTGSDPAGIDAYVKNDLASSEARQFGRQFEIVKFRWLNEGEI